MSTDRTRPGVRVDGFPRKVLIVSYHFPPDTRVGAVRPAKFAKYLARFGWQPYVLTIKSKHIPAPDPRRLEDVEGLPIARTTVWPTATDFLLRLRQKLARLFRRRPGTIVIAGTGRPHDTAGLEAVSWRERLRRMLHAVFEFPDNEVGWVLPAVWRGYRLIKRERIDIVLVSAPPRSSVLIGLILARLTGVRLVTDLRDPWRSRVNGGDVAARPSPTDRLRTRIERDLVERSHQVVTTADRYTALLRQQYPWIAPERFHTITNGYDAEDVSRIAPVVPDATFTLSYLGTFYWTRTPGPLLEALSDLVRTGVIDRSVLRVNFIGTVRDIDGQSLEELVRRYGLDGCVTIRGVVPYEQSLAEMKRSAVLVLIAPEVQYYGIPAKTFEYIAVERPILCLGDRGATADLIRQTRTGIVVNMSNIYDIERAIEQLYKAWRSGAPLTPSFDKTLFERSRLTRELIDVLR
jgi:glycosyltransferase involved in cell wall biosynthesis